MDEFSALQGKYGVNSETEIQPFEDTDFIDSTLSLDDQAEFNDFIGELEELLTDHGVDYVFKNR
jgi:adenine/guanine phosphoribosyltransferase-like PRPP-binding protein